MTNIEIWKDIPNYEGLYQVSNLGKIKSIKNNLILKPITHYLGYIQVSLSGKFYYVHRIVADVYIPKTRDDLFRIYVNHINGDKSDNRYFNLEWCTHSENMKHSYVELNRKSPDWITTNEIHKKKIIQLSKSGDILKEWESLTDAANFLNGSKKNISECLNKRSNTAYGFKWIYK